MGMPKVNTNLWLGAMADINILGLGIYFSHPTAFARPTKFPKILLVRII